MKALLWIAGGIVLVYLGIIITYAIFQRSMLYYPQRISLDDAQRQSTEQGGRPWMSPSGQWLGWVAGSEQTHARRALIFHGNAGMALHREYYVRLFAGFEKSGPWKVYIAEYPGYGPRDGSPSQPSLVEAAVAAMDLLMAEEGATPLLVVGESIGSGVASLAVRARPDAVGALMLVTPFDSMKRLAAHHLPYFPVQLLLRDRFDNLEALGAYTGPLAILTAGKDEIIPEFHAAPLLHQHKGPLHVHRQAEAGHNSIAFDGTADDWKTFDQFLKEHL